MVILKMSSGGIKNHRGCNATKGKIGLCHRELPFALAGLAERHFYKSIFSALRKEGPWRKKIRGWVGDDTDP
jgi:hypothetical protein